MHLEENLKISLIHTFLIPEFIISLLRLTNDTRYLFVRNFEMSLFNTNFPEIVDVVCGVQVLQLLCKL